MIKGVNMTKKRKKLINLTIFYFIASFLGVVAVFFIKNQFLNNNKQSTKTFTNDFTYYETSPGAKHNYYLKAKKVKGVFVNASAAGSKTRLDKLVRLADNTEINAFVIDVKEDDGRITFDMNQPIVKEIGASIDFMDINKVMDKLYDHNIYPIARVVCFKDPYLAKNKKEYAIKNKDGSLWYYKNVAWLNPYNKETWKYIVNVAKEAAKVGFKEIQFDYIRFEATKTLENAYLGEKAKSIPRTKIITDFIDYAKKELEPYQVVVSADVFGIVFLNEKDGQRIGQDYVEMVKRLDVICPMVYPSHYGYGYYNTPSNKHTDWFPYEIIKGSMLNSSEKISILNENEEKAIVRPWLQAFTASYLRNPNYRNYGGTEIREQIKATYDAGLDEWILWHAGSNYDKIESGLLKKK